MQYKSMKHKKLALLLAVMMAFVMSFDISFAEKSLDEINQDIKAKQKELKEGKEKEKSLSSKVNELEEMIGDLDTQIANAEIRLEKLKKQVKKAQKEVDRQNEDLGQRLRNMYKNGSVGFLDVLMNSSSFTEFLTNRDLVEKIYASDKEVLEDLQKAHARLKKKKKQVEKLEASLKASKATAESERAEVAAQKAEIAKNNKETAKMLDDLEAEADAVAAALAAKAADGSISNSSTSEYKGGVFLWPTPGYTTITSGYGWRNCPFHGREFHGAIDIAANGGSNIIASAAGTVISSGYNGGFGYSIQIDHGGGLVTMYNHCSSLLVSYGAKVKKGQVIAKVGSTGSSTGNHLDYRVFKNGSTVNPLSYVQ
ncbi:MAG: peptidoglycan DD-metalloendopeptidase family protein [Firmicutes bacterium]|nr:peptidoglycan DD-metalloendopeptidase family protein [Bacillota bacterium]